MRKFEFRIALTILTILSIAITALLYATGRQSVVSYLFVAFNFGMFINVFMPHLAATIALRKYAPGLLTGLVLLSPITSYLLWYGYKNGFFLFPMFWYATITFAALVIGTIRIFFRIGRRLKGVVDRKDSLG